MKSTLRLLAVALAMTHFTNSVQAITIDMVTVGNPGNAPDLRYRNIPVGSVDYIYNIGKYEITVGQYTAFLNAVARTDTYGLYASDMGSGSFRAYIQRSGSPGSYSYAVSVERANFPVDLISFWDAARFTNWLHNGQPSGLQGPGTTEDGAYLNVGDDATFARQPGAKYFLPNEDEWYKAAYYDPNHGGQGIGGYWDFPTGTNAIPGTDMSDATNTGNNANYNVMLGGFTEVGQFHMSLSPYGTFDQGGNVTEWNESGFLSLRSLRGGSWVNNVDSLFGPKSQAGNFPTINGASVGFRIASLAVPEPSSGSLWFILASLALNSRRFNQAKDRAVQPQITNT